MYQMLLLGLGEHTFPDGTLLLRAVTKRAEGIYTCAAKNDVRGVISKSVNVTVNGK